MIFVSGVSGVHVQFEMQVAVHAYAEIIARRHLYPVAHQMRRMHEAVAEKRAPKYFCFFGKAAHIFLDFYPKKMGSGILRGRVTTGPPPNISLSIL